MSLKNTHYGADAIRERLASCHALFFIGIGGISMSSLAQMSLLAGYRVGGSDRNENAQTKHLIELGVTVHRGHAAELFRAKIRQRLTAALLMPQDMLQRIL